MTSPSVIQQRIEDGLAAQQRQSKVISGIRKGYAWCGWCHDTFDFKKPHSIDVVEDGKLSFGAFVYCEECHPIIPLGRKKELITQLVNEWIGYAKPEEVAGYLREEQLLFEAVENGL